MQTTSYLVGEKSKMMWGKSRVEGKRKKKVTRKKEWKEKLENEKRKKWLQITNLGFFLHSFLFINVLFVQQSCNNWELILVPPKLLLTPTIKAQLPKYYLFSFLSYWLPPHTFFLFPSLFPFSLSSFLPSFLISLLPTRIHLLLMYFLFAFSITTLHNGIMIPFFSLIF